MKTIEVEDIKALDIKDKLLIIKSENNIDRHIVESFRKNLMEKGCLGIINIAPEFEIEALGLAQLEDIVAQIKERIKYENTKTD